MFEEDQKLTFDVAVLADSSLRVLTPHSASVMVKKYM
jgi:hypothetical protein